MQRIAVVGAGVTGLTATVHLMDRFPGKLDLTLLADKFSPDTLSDKSAMMFLPTLPMNNSSHSQDEDFKRWMLTSFTKFQSIFNSAENAEVGISLLHGYAFWNSPQPEPWWKNEMFGFRHVEMESAEAKGLSVPSDCVDILTFGMYTMNPTLFLQWLMRKVRKGGCKVEKRKISSLDELTCSYDIVINCTGLSSCKELLLDPHMYPVRGQLVVVKAPWVKHWMAYFKSGFMHTGIIPRGSEVILGGIYEVGDWNEATDPDTAKNIIKRCQDLVPSVCGAEVVGGWAGLRPGRDHVRLEGCEGQGSSLLIHCYGHGGKGMALSWGCAMDIGDIVEQKLMNSHTKTSSLFC